QLGRMRGTRISSLWPLAAVMAVMAAAVALATARREGQPHGADPAAQRPAVTVDAEKLGARTVDLQDRAYRMP
ncbi:MAG: hypothetical protein JWO33_2092, partial [Caulobacteraceae bacterium]|nr:hypothetical protein [Caulobacteraceae bacterium]